MRKPKWSYRFYKNYRFQWIPNLYRVKKVLWKDKFESPRCEREPQFRIEWLWFGLFGIQEDDQYWEQWLWVHVYCDGNIEKAEQTWGWIDMDTKESTWVNYASK